MKRKIIFSAVLVISLLVTPFLTSFSLAESFSLSERKIDLEYSTNTKLPVIGSYQKLKNILKDIEERAGFNNGYMYFETLSIIKTADKSTESSVNDDGNYSGTNIQVQGVDEADKIKTDGEYIYQVTNDKVIIAKAYPAKEMQVVKIIDYDNTEYVPYEIYLNDKYLVVIGNNYENQIWIQEQQGKSTQNILPPHFVNNNVKILIYDISNKSDISKVRELVIDGEYLSSRKIGSSLYFITNKYLDVYYILNNNGELSPPAYYDSNINKNINYIDYNKIHYFPGSNDTNYLLIGGIDLDKMDEPLSVSTYLGSGQNIYASENNLYVTVTHFNIETKEKIQSSMFHNEVFSRIYKFKLDSGKVEFLNQGDVPGTVLNQFSMDEHNGYFRIATTVGDMFSTGEDVSKNNLYVLDEELKVVGKLEGIAPGERIYSVRFMGDRGYMVTFKKVDPLFVIDLANPSSPKILGKLKIPGYSDYLHPYDENHVIGFGKDAVEAVIDGQKMDWALYQGMKIALFDVTDVNKPKEKFVEIIGDRGTDSELLYNHKALLFSKDKNLLALPVTVMEIKDKKASTDLYGEFTFQGAYIYQVDLENGFNLRKKITHLNNEDYMKAGQYWYDSNKNISRIIYIEDTLYTISNAMIKAHNLSDLKEINNLEFATIQ